MGVRNYLIDGASCSGKTTVCGELQGRGYHAIHGEKELIEKLGRNDPCPCGSGRRFEGLLYAQRAL